MIKLLEETQEDGYGASINSNSFFFKEATWWGHEITGRGINLKRGYR